MSKRRCLSTEIAIVAGSARPTKKKKTQSHCEQRRVVPQQEVVSPTEQNHGRELRERTPYWPEQPDAILTEAASASGVPGAQKTEPKMSSTTSSRPERSRCTSLEQPVGEPRRPGPVGTSCASAKACPVACGSDEEQHHPHEPCLRPTTARTPSRCDRRGGGRRSRPAPGIRSTQVPSVQLVGDHARLGSCWETPGSPKKNPNRDPRAPPAATPIPGLAPP